MRRRVELPVRANAARSFGGAAGARRALRVHVMRVQTFFETGWSRETADRDSVTQLYVKPAPAPEYLDGAPVWVPQHWEMPSARMQWNAAAVQRRTQTQAVRRVRVPRVQMMGIGFAALCVL